MTCPTRQTRRDLLIPVANCALLFALTSAVPATAEEFVPSRVPDTARWVMHVDLERLMQSELAEVLTPEHGELPVSIEDGSAWDELRQRTGIDLNADIKAVTLYNAGPLAEDSVMVLVTTDTTDEVVRELPEILPSHRVTTFDGHEVHSWTEIVDDIRKRWFAHVRPGEAPDRRICVLSENWEQLLDSIERIAEPGSSPSPAVLHDAPPQPGSLMYFAAGEINDFGDFSGDGSQSNVVRMIRSVVMDLRQVDDEFALDALLTTQENVKIEDLAQILQGFVALARMTIGNDPEMKDAQAVLARLRITPDNGRLRISIACPVDLIAGSIRSSGLALDSRLRPKSYDLGVTIRDGASKIAPGEAAQE